MQAIILAGGRGRRLLPYTTVLPKPLMPIGDYSILEVILRQLKFYGFDEITISTGYLSELINAYISHRRKDLDLEIKFVHEGPGQDSSYVCGHIIAEIIKIMNGEQDAIHLQEIESCRDFIDIRDAVCAYWSILDQDHFLETCAGNAFNVGSGKSYSVSEILETIEEITGKKYPVELP